ncbi:MAG: xylose isomerase [Mesorhizobium sp.]|uniref:TIM barrel protein n=1 Tax=Mesorhizobium sp. TaxID=1871066 RepID=UPI001216821A|nr:TIM barrel protein [Mesorhizobium sp.]TIP27754.1 MAG: xylose isomerase [Mesorhizobium sp.]
MLPRLALNGTVSPFRDLAAFLDLAREAGVQGVEIRNDIEGRELADGTSAGELASRIADAGLTIASINALQRFNDWDRERAAEARALIEYAGACGAPGLVLCPSVDHANGRSPAQLAKDLRHSLRELKPILAANGVVGLVEPLGMIDSTLRFKAPAVEAIGEIDGFRDFALCHDSFQHFRCSDTAIFPEYTGIVHISGVVEKGLPRETLTEPLRGFVGDDDICGNIEQLRILFRGGYDGFISFEPFDPALQRLDDPRPPLKASIAYLHSSFAPASADDVMPRRPGIGSLTLRGG